jgi:radical SAM superfamily enzyme YgiQ (UPF0313 family)
LSFARPDIIRPPSEAGSYFLPLTGGCSNNTCTFCGWNGSRLRLRDPNEVKREIDALAEFRKTRLLTPELPEIARYIAAGWDGKRIFLQDGDALVYPYEKLVEVLGHLKEKLPGVSRVAAYATPQDLLRLEVKQLEQLKALGLGIIYLGVESGDDAVLKNVCKGATHEEIVTGARRVKEAGITLSVTVILGLGGQVRSREHTLATAQILSEIDPEFAGALTLTIVPGTPLEQERRSGGFKLISPFDSLGELRTIIEHAKFTNCFFSSMHASNYLSVRGTLPQDKEIMLQSLSEVLSRGDAGQLRPEFMRGL